MADPFYIVNDAEIYLGDSVDTMFELWEVGTRVRCAITSPPYYKLRDYGIETKQIGQEPTIGEYVANVCTAMDAVHDMLTDNGTLWLNLGDSYDRKTGSMYDAPARISIEMQNRGWIKRNTIVWAKPNPSPTNVKDRCNSSHEYVFLFVKQIPYYFDMKASLQPFADARQGRDGGTKGRERNRGGRDDGLTKASGIDPSANGGAIPRDVWTIAHRGDSYRSEHTAVFPEELVERCMRAGSEELDWVLDPFAGSGTVAAVANRLGRQSISIDASPAAMLDMIRRLT